MFLLPYFKKFLFFSCMLLGFPILMMPPCHAKSSVKTTPPSLRVETDSERDQIHVQTSAPQYIIEWDTTKSFQHKKVYALYRGTDYQAFVYPGSTTSICLHLPDKDRTYFVRAYSIYPRQGKRPLVSRASSVLTISPDKTAAKRKAPVIKTFKTPKIKTSVNKTNACIEITLTLPDNATGYMIECSRLKSFPFSKLHTLYWDSADYYIRYNHTVSSKTQYLEIALSELAGTATYIRAYAVCDQPDKNRSAISKPTRVKKVSWK